MKKLISVLLTAALAAALVIPAFAADFDPSLTVDRSTENVILVTVANDAQTNEILSTKQPKLTIDCALTGAKLLGGGGHTELTVTEGKVTFSVTHGGAYVIVSGDYTVTTTAATCTTAGKYVYAVGGSSYEETIPAKGHDFSNAHCPTCANCSAVNPYYTPYVPAVDPAPDEEPETEPPQATFTDVAEGSYCYDAVQWAVESKVTTGVSDNEFAPSQDCGRVEIITFLWRAAGSPEPEGTVTSVTDVKTGSYCEKAVLWALENGITKGDGSGAFGMGNVTRAQAVTFLWRLAGCPAANGGNGFRDVDAEAYYAQAVQWAVEQGITYGTGGDRFSPDTVCSRGEVVTFLYRYFAD